MRIDLASHKSLEQVRAFLESLGADGSEPLLPEREEQYGHIQRSLVRFGYRTLRRAERGLVLEYLRRTTGLSRSQVTKLVGRSQREAHLQDRRRLGRPFASKYTSQPPHPENCGEQVRLLPHLLQICINGKYAGNTKFKVAVCQSIVD